MTDFNARRCAGTPGTYEVWYMTWNDPKTDHGFWLRYVIEAPTAGGQYGELWFARFDPTGAKTFGVHKRFDVLADRPLTIGNASFVHDAARGEFENVKWNLRWAPAAAPLKLLPDLAYTLKIGKTTPVWPNPRVPMSGEVTVAGETYKFDKVPMGQAHLWGTKHAYEWTWAHIADFAGTNALLELLAVRLAPKVPPLVMARMMLDGEQHELNQFRHVARNRATWSGSRVEFEARSTWMKVEGELWCKPDDMVVAPYLDPDGTEVFCSNTEIGDARLRIYRRSGLRWREIHTLEAKKRAHFELGSRVRDPAVTREHILVP